jgi:tripartite ATP-independent transporter DctM subunit
MVFAVIAALFFLTTAVGIPIAFSTGLAAVGGILATGGIQLNVLVIRTLKALDSFPLMAVPFFVLAGEVMARGQVTERLVRFSEILVGRISGGLAQAAIVACTIFAGITGSSTADATAIGSVMLPAMKAKKYPHDFSCAVIASAAVLGPIIPPSITFVIYAMATGVSIGGMFMAGIIPGLLIALGLMLVAYIISRRNHFPRAAEPLTWKETGAILRTSALSMVLPILIVGGILGGIFTPTEAAAVGAAYAIILCVCILKTLPLRSLPSILFESAKISSIIWLLLATTNILVWVLAINNVGPAVGGFFLSVSGNVYVFLLVVNLFLLVVGMLMDTFPAIMILAPLLHPLAVQLGVHPLHFGIIMSVNLLIGQITPPVGTNLFILSAIGHISIERLFRAVIPFLLIEIVVLFILTYVPALTLWIPRMLGYL